MANILTWEEMVEKYPDMWVAIKNAEFKGSTLLSGEVVTSLTDDEVDKHELENLDKNYFYTRTSLTFKLGVINVK